MAGTEKDKRAVESAAVNSPTNTGAASGMDVFNNALGAAGVIVGKNTDGTNKTVTLKEWQDRWFKMPESERQKYVNQWSNAGIKTDVVNGVTTWIAYGQKSVQLSQYGGVFTPKMLMAQDVASRQGSGTGAAAFTAKDAEALVQSAYQSLLGRDATGDEYSRALGLALGQSKQTGATGRQQSVIDYIKGTQEYDAKMENKYLDAMYSQVAGKVQAAEA